MPQVDLLVLANARKHLGRCVAGLKLDGSGWIRLVSKRPDGTLNWSEYLLEKGEEARLLDVISAGVRSPRPVIHQPENHVIDGIVWKIARSPHPESIAQLLKRALVPGPELFGGCRDRVAMAEIEEKPCGASLALVAPAWLELALHNRSDGKQQVRGRFELGTSPKAVYDLSVTDPPWENTVREKRKMLLKQTEQKFVLCISLGEPFNGNCYKLLAGIVLLPAELAKTF